MTNTWAVFLAGIVLPAQVTAQAPSTIENVRQSLVGRWEGKLEYRDYQADRWSGLPVKVEVKDGGDAVTLVRVADFDDGPVTGNVRITTVSMLGADGRSETSAAFRKGRAVELSKANLSLIAGNTPDNWTMVEMINGTDGDRPAKIRLTSTRTGASLVTLKEVDFSGDKKTEWLVRNRTTLTRTR